MGKTGKRTKRVILTIAAVVLAMTVFAGGFAVGQSTQRFSDLPPDHYAHDAAIWADAAGITRGCGDGTQFCPDDNLNRAQMITFLKRYEDWTQNGRPYPNSQGAGAGLACLTSERGCDITLASLGIERDKVLIVGVDIAPGNWRAWYEAGGRDCVSYAILNEDIKTHPSYPGPSQYWSSWVADLVSLPDHGYTSFRTASHLTGVSIDFSVEPTDFAVIYSTYRCP